MNRLVVRLRKSGKQGLVAIQKQVTKKGKTFTQTFYVKPETTPKAPSSPSPVESMENYVSGPWKGPLGDQRVYVSFFDTKRNAVRVPEEAVYSRFTWKGFNFVIHKKLRQDNKKFSATNYVVTEATTGLTLMGGTTDDPEQLRKDADEFIEMKGYDNIAKAVNHALKIADIPSEDFIETVKVEAPKVVASEEDYDRLAEHLRVNVLDYSSADEPIHIGFIKEWVKKTGDYDSLDNIEGAISSFSSSDWEALELAIKYNLRYDAAHSIYEDLSELRDYIFVGYPREDILDWYDEHYNGSPLDHSITSLGTSSDYGNEWTIRRTIEYALDNNVTLGDAQSYAEQDTANADRIDEDYDEENHHTVHSVTDSHGNYWDEAEVEMMVSWMEGNLSRDVGRSFDDQLRQGNVPNIPYRHEMSTLMLTKATDVPYERLYRGSPNPIWAEIQPGDTYEHSFSSFSKSENFAREFHSARANSGGYHKFLIILEAPEGESIKGIDLHDIGQSLEGQGNPHHVFDNYENEQEVTVRAPSLEVTRVEDATYTAGYSGETKKMRKIFVKPGEMELLDLLKSRFTDIASAVWESFNEPLGAPRGNSKKPDAEESDD